MLSIVYYVQLMTEERCKDFKTIFWLNKLYSIHWYQNQDVDWPIPDLDLEEVLVDPELPEVTKHERNEQSRAERWIEFKVVFKYAIVLWEWLNGLKGTYHRSYPCYDPQL